MSDHLNRQFYSGTSRHTIMWREVPELPAWVFEARKSWRFRAAAVIVRWRRRRRARRAQFRLWG